MEHVTLGGAGLQVSRVCLGTANFGWQLERPTAAKVLDAALAAGVTFIDTADAYPGAEDALGELLAGRRDEVILATKGGGPTSQRPWDSGTSRKHLLDAVEGSLRRLGTDYVDVYFPHIYDPRTPLDETLDALDTIVTSGKARYIGCSNYLAYQIARALGRSEVKGIARFVCVQARYNLLSRQIEQELVPLCLGEQLGIMAYNPLAGGLLSGKHDRSAPPEEGGRFSEKAGAFGAMYRARYWHDAQFDAVDELRQIAADAGLSLPTLAVGWALQLPGLSSVMVGASKPEQLADTLAALDTPLDADLVARVRSATDRWRFAPA